MLQKNGLGYGDPLENVNIRTVHSLYRKGLIYPSGKSHGIDTTQYLLTEEGKKAK